MASSKDNVTAGITAGILTVSDSCYRGEASDESGAALQHLLHSASTQLQVARVERCCVPDDGSMIRDRIKTWCDVSRLDIILTTGGTGVSPRDVTPDVTRALVDKELTGMSVAMINASLSITPMAMLSRPVCGTRGRTLVINLPGSKKACKECLEVVMPALRHALHLLRDDVERVRDLHKEMQHGATSLKNSQESDAQNGALMLNEKVENDQEVSRKVSGVEVTFKVIDNPETTSKVSVGKPALRHRHSPYPMIKVSDALEIVYREAHEDLELHCVEVDYRECVGYILSEDIHAREPFPAFPASIKDGYAVLSSDGCGRRVVVRGAAVAGGNPAGVPATLAAGTCVRINTGAILPPGADAVVQVEDTRVLATTSDGWEEVEVDVRATPGATPPRPGEDIRAPGSDISKGQLVLERGCKLAPAHVGLLATLGITKMPVYERPKVAVLSTGNELVPPFTPSAALPTGFIRDSNKDILIQIIREHGFTAADAGIALDEPNAILQAFHRILPSADVIITSGGVSMGDKDLIKQVLQEDLGATIHFAQVFMKPGKPTVFSTLIYDGKKKLVLSLPGNPVSAAVTSNLYVLPVIRILSGYDIRNKELVDNRRMVVELHEDMKLDRRPEYHRSNLRWLPGRAVPLAESTGSQMSCRLTSMSGATCLLQLPPATDTTPVLKAGEMVTAIIISPWI